MEDRSRKVIIKKVKKGHGGQHGGSWKVAYADFVTAMMAFFLLMWLMSMVSPEKQSQTANYFKTYSLFDKPGRSFVDGGDTTPLVKSPGEKGRTFSDPYHNGSHTIDGTEEQLLAEVRQEIKGLPDGFKERVVVDRAPEGVRLQIFDIEGSPLFQSGSNIPTERGRSVFMIAAGILRRLPADVILQGNTDPRDGRIDQSEEWRISALRATTAMREFIAAGFPESRVIRIEGFANTVPLIKSNPQDPRNRRISVILFKKKEPPEIKLKPHP